MLLSRMRPKRLFVGGGIALSAALLLGFADPAPDRIAEYSRAVEEVRGRKFERSVPATEIDASEVRQILRTKLVEGLPAPAPEYFRSLYALGLVDEGPRLLDRLLDFYASQVIAFYDPGPRRFFLVRGAEGLAGGGAETTGLAEGLIYSHELTHALQDESLRLDNRVKQLKDDSDRGFALQCLLEGEATLVMIRVALRDIPGADARAEEELAPLLSAGGLERANVPADVPKYFVDQLFFPYVEGTAYVRAALKKGGWAEVDHLWKSPPESSAEIIHGAPYPPPAGGLLPSNVATLWPGQRLVYTDTLGEWTLRFLLERALPAEEAGKAASGWRGDRIAFLSAAGGMGYLWRIRFEDGLSSARFEAAFRKARAKRPVSPAETIRRSGRDVVIASGIEKVPELP